jgi:hypothetical protein
VISKEVSAKTSLHVFGRLTLQGKKREIFRYIRMMNASGCRLVCCRHLFLIAILIVFIDRYIDASRAPDRAPILPDGWCKGGKPTATTGECICSPGVCVGQGCRRDSGFEWYTPHCSMCHCEKKGTTASQAGVNGGGTTTGSGVGVDDGVRTAFTAKSRAKPVPVDLHRADLQEEKAEVRNLI